MTQNTASVLLAPQCSPVNVLVQHESPACPPPAITAANTNPTLSIVVTIVIAVLGWWVVHNTQSIRERRKQTREFIAKLKEDLLTVEQLAIDYHTSARDLKKEREMEQRLARFEHSYMLVLPRFNRKAWPWAKKQLFCEEQATPEKQETFNNFRRALTLKHFGGEHDQPADITSDLAQIIQTMTLNVRADLDNLFLVVLD